METLERRPGVNARPGRTTRSVVYPAFAHTGPDEPVAGTRPIYLYLRLSKYHKDKADAIERQRIDLTRMLATEGGWTVMGEYIDNDSASSSAIKTRKGWRQLNLDIRAEKVKAVAFWKLDRTNRIAAKCIEWIGDCQRASVLLRSHQDSTDELNTATAGAKLVTGIKALLAEVETDSMSERQLASKRHLAEAGFHHGGTPPFGWVAGPRMTDQLGRTGIRLVPHPVEHQALKDAVDMVLAGKSLAQIGRFWKERYEITTASGAYVYEATIYRSLTSPRMIGYRMRQVPEHQRGVKLDLLDYIARDANGDPVISQEPVCDRATWLRVRRLLEQAKTSKARKPWGSHEWLLTGLLYCQCGGRLYGLQKKRKRAGGESETEYVYRCMTNRHRGTGNCPGGCTISATKAEAYVLGWFFSQITDDALAKARARRRMARADDEVNTLLTQLDEASAEKDALLVKQGTGDYRGAMVTVLLGLIEGAQDRIDAIQRRIETVELDELMIADGPDVIRSWGSKGIKERRNYLRRMIHQIDALPGRGPIEGRIRITPVG
ncbi:DNA invertase Pin-like site-specific DNA recombinase [Leucobacter luti]|uniref:DNA invertase Pin-like site-specific DNA recombinase n=1 Tax=Leucobacter luti TaxID=340320 RepID=A0A4R6RWH6_9MICO|nr:recombinase family protein [Leucobacter luti]TDP91381.1 DNA invertase Pin-like site-specific DNA recombinase [Leucobacter luti]